MTKPILLIGDEPKMEFVRGLQAVSTWSHSVNQHNGFWESPERMLKLLDSRPEDRDADEQQMMTLIILAAIAKIHTEPSEAVEAVRKHDPGTWAYTEKDSLVSEMAGTVVRIMDLCEWLGLPLGEAIVAEINRNSKRGYMHGGGNKA